MHHRLPSEIYNLTPTEHKILHAFLRQEVEEMNESMNGSKPNASNTRQLSRGEFNEVMSKLKDRERVTDG